MSTLDRMADMQKQGVFRGIAKRADAAARKAAARQVTDAQFRENIRRQVARETRIMFGEEEALPLPNNRKPV